MVLLISLKGRFLSVAAAAAARLSLLHRTRAAGASHLGPGHNDPTDAYKLRAVYGRFNVSPRFPPPVETEGALLDYDVDRATKASLAKTLEASPRHVSCMASATERFADTSGNGGFRVCVANISIDVHGGPHVASSAIPMADAVKQSPRTFHGSEWPSPGGVVRTRARAGVVTLAKAT
jgi:hypothetical protein